MAFLTANIDRAIVMTQYDLRGFAHPLGWREPYMESAKSFDATTANFLAFAAGCGGGRIPTEPIPDYFESPYEECLAAYQTLAADCDLSQKEAIQLIIQEIAKQNREMRAQVAAAKRHPSVYLGSLDKDNRWGRTVLALAEAFEVDLESLPAQAV